MILPETIIEKRKLERFELNLSVKMVVDDKVFDDIYTEDISSQGMFVLTNTPMILGAMVGVEVYMPVVGSQRDKGKNMLAVTGKVVRTEQRGLGIHFNPITANDSWHRFCRRKKTAQKFSSLSQNPLLVS